MAVHYLSQDVLNGFDKYKYTSIDNSPVSNYITHPFWNQVVKLCPRWIAPNLLTLVGFLFLIFNFLVLSFFDYHFFASSDIHSGYPSIPQSIWLLSAVCIFLAHTLDGIDGKQARRTGTSGPLGELFDHGLDSWATFFLPVCVYSVFGRGDHSIEPLRVFYVLIGVMFTFAISHWEKYNTGVLFLPWGYDVSQMAMTGVYVITWVQGYQFWKFKLPLINLSSGHLFEFVMHVSVYGISLPMSFWNVYKSYRDKTGKMLGVYESCRPLIPVLILILLMLTWAHSSRYNIVREEPRLFYLAMGTAFSNIACRLIVSGMSNTRSQVFSWLLVPLMAIVAGIKFLHLGVLEAYLLWAYTIFVTAAHIHYGICVVQQLSTHLNIYVFSVKKVPSQKDE